jgi:hypothetical protein
MQDACDTAVLVTGDTDLAAAVRVAQRLFPNKMVSFAFPYKRRNKDLADMVKFSFQIDKDSYVRHQFPDLLVLPSGKAISKPAHW